MRGRFSRGNRPILLEYPLAPKFSTATIPEGGFYFGIHLLDSESFAHGPSFPGKRDIRSGTEHGINSNREDRVHEAQPMLAFRVL